MRLTLALLLLGLFLLSAASPAVADDSKTAARQAYRRALQHYNLAEWSPALASFTEAYRLYEEPSFLFNIAQCHRQLGHQQDAITFYRSFLRNTPDAKNREEVQQLISRLETSVAAESAAKKAPPQEAREPVGPGAIVPAPIAPPVVEVRPTEPPPPPDRPRLRYAGYALLGLGVAGLAVGGGLMGAASSENSALNKPAAGTTWDQSRVNHMYDLNNAGLAMIGVGVGLAVTGAVLAIVGRARPRPQHAGLAFGAVRF